MFVRKRVNIDKKGKAWESYQVIETYRENGKVKQRYICNLRWYSTPEDALANARERLQRAELSGPTKAYNCLGHYVRNRHKREEERLKDLEKLQARVAELEGVVSGMRTKGNILDTTEIEGGNRERI